MLCWRDCEKSMLPDNDQKPSLLTRRGGLRLLALTGASIAAGSGTSHAFMDFFSTYEDVPRGVLTKFDIPSRVASATWLFAPELRRLSPANQVPPDDGSPGDRSPRQVARQHAQYTSSAFHVEEYPVHAEVVDSLADRLDMPVKEVVSVYRTPAYNARCPGAKSNSFIFKQRDGYCVQVSARQGGSDGPRDALRRLVQRRRGTLRKLYPHRYSNAPWVRLAVVAHQARAVEGKDDRQLLECRRRG